jgi:hypothetical protein
MEPKLGSKYGITFGVIGALPLAVLMIFLMPVQGTPEYYSYIPWAIPAFVFCVLMLGVGSKLDMDKYLDAHPDLKAMTERWYAAEAREKAEGKAQRNLYVAKTDQKTMYTIGIVVLLVAGAALLMVWRVGSEFGGWEGLATLILSILGLVAGVKLVKVGHNAPKKYAEDVSHMTSVAQSLLQREIALVETSLVRHKLLMQHEFDQHRMQHELSLMDERLMTEQVHGQLDRQLMRAASNRGVDVPTLMLFEKTLELDRLELEKQWREAEQEINAALFSESIKRSMASGLTPHPHLDTLRQYINSLYKQAESATGREKSLLEKHIKFMEGDFNARQKLIQADNRGRIQGSH